MDRGWSRLERIVLSRVGPTALHIRPREGCLGIDERVSGSDPVEYDNRSERSHNLFTHGSAGTMRRRNYVEHQPSPATVSFHLPIYSRYWYYPLLWSGTDVSGRQHKEEKYTYALR